MRADGDGTVSIVEDLELSDYALAKMRDSEAELLAEREAIQHLL